MTLIEVLVVILIIGVLVAMLVPTRSFSGPARLPRCMSNLHQQAVAFWGWAADNRADFPMQISTNHGGSREYNSGHDAFQHFALLAPYLDHGINETTLLVCPADERTPAFQFALLDNSHLSYFIGLEASTNSPDAFLAGDRFITNDLPGEAGVVKLSAVSTIRWTGGHKSSTERFRGVVGFSDGHVESPKLASLQTRLTNLQARTVRLLVP
jgi:hypothetical protein